MSDNNEIMRAYFNDEGYSRFGFEGDERCKQHKYKHSPTLECMAPKRDET